MGEAKRRGTYEERKAQAIARRETELNEKNGRLETLRQQYAHHRGRRAGVAASIAAAVSAAMFPGGVYLGARGRR